MNCKICGYNLKQGQQICPNCGIILDTFSNSKDDFRSSKSANDDSVRVATKPATETTQVFKSVQEKQQVDPMRYAVKPEARRQPPKSRKRKNNNSAKVAVLSVFLVIVSIACIVFAFKAYDIFPFVEETTTTTTTQPTTIPEYKTLFEYEINGGNAIITKYIGSDSSVIIPNEIEGKKVTKIGDMAFHQSIVVQTVTFQSSVIEIGAQAFASCSKLSSVILTDNLRSIGDQAFYDCPALSYIVLPSTITNFGRYIFGNCPNILIECSQLSEAYRYCKDNDYKYRLKAGESETTKTNESTVAPGIENVSDPSKIYITEPYLNGLTIKGASINLSNYEIPQSINGLPVLALSDYAFAKNSTVTKVTIPSTVRKIGKYAFSYCPNLTSVAFDSLTIVFGKDSFLHGGKSDLMRFTVIDQSTAMDYAIVNNINYSLKQ